MDGETRGERCLNESLQSQLAGGLLDDETAATVAQVLMNLTVARNLVMLTLDDPAAARGLLRTAARQARAAATALDTWRDGGRQASVATT